MFDFKGLGDYIIFDPGDTVFFSGETMGITMLWDFIHQYSGYYGGFV